MKAERLMCRVEVEQQIHPVLVSHIKTNIRLGRRDRARRLRLQRSASLIYRIQFWLRVSIYDAMLERNIAFLHGCTPSSL